MATHLMVVKEYECTAHVSAQYWSIDTAFTSAGQVFDVCVSSVDDHSITTGSDFSERSELSVKTFKADVPRLNQAIVYAYTQALSDAPALVVDSMTRRPYRRHPAAPFTTSTLQQEVSRKLYWNTFSTIYIAQPLYESDYIAYMRADSTVLSSQAIHVVHE